MNYRVILAPNTWEGAVMPNANSLSRPILAVVALLAPRPWVPLLGVAVGSVAGLIFNFTASRRFVFRTGVAEK